MSTQTMKGYLDHIEIRGFRSLKDVSVDLSPLTVLIGANGAGKSNFIKFFELIIHLMKGDSLKRWVEDAGGSEDLLFMGSRITWHIMASLGISTYQDGEQFKYGVSLRNVGIDNLAFTSEVVSYKQQGQWLMLDDALGESYDASVLPFVAQNSKLTAEQKQYAKRIAKFLVNCRVYHFHDTSRHAIIKKYHDITDSVYLNQDGGNLAAVLLSLREQESQRFKLIENQIRRVLPAFDGFILEPVNGKVMLRWRHKDSEKTMGAHLTSDGSLRLFCLITLFNLPDERLPDVILLDEPELGLHPYAIQLLAGMMKSASKRSQIIASTQSVTLANEMEWQDIVVVQYENNASRFVRLDEQQLKPWLENYAIGDIWQKNLIGGTPVC